MALIERGSIQNVGHGNSSPTLTGTWWWAWGESKGTHVYPERLAENPRPCPRRLGEARRACPERPAGTRRNTPLCRNSEGGWWWAWGESNSRHARACPQKPAELNISNGALAHAMRSLREVKLLVLNDNCVFVNPHNRSRVGIDFNVSEGSFEAGHARVVGFNFSGVVNYPNKSLQRV